MPRQNGKPEDSRVKRSKRDLANALEELLQEKNLDDITVQEIANRAMVSKNTFYNNFFDKNELVMFMFSRYMDEIFAKADIFSSDGSNKREVLTKCLEAAVHFFYKDGGRFKKMVANDHSKTMYWNINKFIQQIVSYVFANYPQIITVDVPEPMVASFYAGAVSNLIYFSFLGTPKVKESEAVAYLAKLFPTEV